MRYSLKLMAERARLQRLAMLAAFALLGGCHANNDAAAPKSCTGLARDEMVWVPAGRFTMGEDAHYREEGPPRDVAVALAFTT